MSAGALPIDASRLLTEVEVREILSISRTQLYRIRQDDAAGFPAPVYLMKLSGLQRWRESEVLAWREANLHREPQAATRKRRSS